MGRGFLLAAGEGSGARGEAAAADSKWWLRRRQRRGSVPSRPLPGPRSAAGAPELGPGGAGGPALPLALGARRGEPREAQRAPGRPAGVWVPAARSGPAAGSRSETGRSRHAWDARGWDRSSGCLRLGW